ncbi:MAG: hypothetical protein R2874_08385 [Desulfobacterales bacterium]
MTTPAYKRVLLKLSGEALMGDQPYGISTDMLRYMAEEVKSAYDLGVEMAIVVGGGNIFRGWPPPPRAWTGPLPITWECWPR